MWIGVDMLLVRQLLILTPDKKVTNIGFTHVRNSYN